MKSSRGRKLSNQSQQRGGNQIISQQKVLREFNSTVRRRDSKDATGYAVGQGNRFQAAQ